MTEWTTPIRGKTWTVREVTGRTLWKEYRRTGTPDKGVKRLYGLCIEGERLVLYRTGMSREQRYSILAHELMHAHFPSLSHTKIAPFEQDLFTAMLFAKRH